MQTGPEKMDTKPDFTQSNLISRESEIDIKNPGRICPDSWGSHSAAGFGCKPAFMASRNAPGIRLNTRSRKSNAGSQPQEQSHDRW